jgi:hypothetical protein
MFSLNLEEDVWDNTGGDNYCPVLDLTLRPGEGQDARWRQLLYTLDFSL